MLPPNILKHNLYLKIDARSKLEKKYEEIVPLQDPDWSLAALVRIGQINQNLGQSMGEAPIPHDLTPSQQDSYVQELQKQALPFEEKAIGSYQKVIAIATAKGIYNDWMLQAQDLLHVYQPTLYPEPFKAGIAPSQNSYHRGLIPEKVDDSATSGNAHYNVGVNLMSTGDGDGARREFESALKIDPTHRDAMLNLGELSKEENNYILAIDVYKNALRVLPNDPLILNNLVVCYRLTRQYQEAEAVGYRLLAHAPENVEAYKNMALVYLDQGTYEMAETFAIHAINLLQRQRQNDPSIPEDAGSYNNLGLVYFKSGRPHDALQQFSKALEIKPDHLGALINIGALAHQYRDYARAQAVYEKVLKVDPNNHVASRGLAYAVFGSGNTQRTIELMNGLLARNPDEIKAYYILGVILIRSSMILPKPLVTMNGTLPRWVLPSLPTIRLKRAWPRPGPNSKNTPKPLG